MFFFFSSLYFLRFHSPLCVYPLFFVSRHHHSNRSLMYIITDANKPTWSIVHGKMGGGWTNSLAKPLNKRHQVLVRFFCFHTLMACYSIYDWGGHCAKILVHSFDYLLRAPNECWTQPRLSGIHNFFWLFVDCKLPKPKEYRRIILCAPPHGTSLFICSASLFRALGLVDVIHCSSSLLFLFSSLLLLRRLYTGCICYMVRFADISSISNYLFPSAMMAPSLSLKMFAYTR